MTKVSKLWAENILEKQRELSRNLARLSEDPNLSEVQITIDGEEIEGEEEKRIKLQALFRKATLGRGAKVRYFHHPDSPTISQIFNTLLDEGQDAPTTWTIRGEEHSFTRGQMYAEIRNRLEAEVFDFALDKAMSMALEHKAEERKEAKYV